MNADSTAGAALRITSCQAPNSEYIAAAVVGYLRARHGFGALWVDDVTWPERYAALDAGRMGVAWICGAPYVRRVDGGPAGIELLAAPVWRGERYGDRPIYFSDVAVRAGSRYRTFADLRSARWAYNEPGSLSGYECVRDYLAGRGLDGGFFGAVVQAGSHQRAFDLILAGEVDAAAIDSTVLEEELRRRPDLAGRIRIVETIGPNPMPPWVASVGVPAPLREALRAALTTMHEDGVGAAVLAATPVARFAAVADADYEPVRALLRRAERVQL
jgi:phosphonate transport system substrate-binding protein